MIGFIFFVAFMIFDMVFYMYTPDDERGHWLLAIVYGSGYYLYFRYRYREYYESRCIEDDNVMTRLEE